MIILDHTCSKSAGATGRGVLDWTRAEDVGAGLAFVRALTAPLEKTPPTAVGDGIGMPPLQPITRDIPAIWDMLGDMGRSTLWSKQKAASVHTSMLRETHIDGGVFGRPSPTADPPSSQSLSSTFT